MWTSQDQMARSLSNQRRVTQNYVEVFDNDNLLSPILSESEPEDDDTETSGNKRKHAARTVRTLTNTANKLDLRTELKRSCREREKDDHELSDFEREERRCNKDSSDSDEGGKAKSGNHHQPKAKSTHRDTHQDFYPIDSDPEQANILLSEPDWDSDSIGDKDDPVSPDFTVEIVNSPKRKSLREVIDTVDEAFSIEDPELTDEFSPAPSNSSQVSKSSDPVDNSTRSKIPLKRTSKSKDTTARKSTNQRSISHPTFAKMSESVGSDDVFDPFAPANGIEIFEPKPKVLEDPFKVDSESKFEVVDDSFKVVEPTEPTDKKEDDEYCDSLDGGDSTEDIRDIQPPDAMYEEDLKAEANALALSIAQLSADRDEDTIPEEPAGTPDSLEPDLEALDDAASLQEPKGGPGPKGKTIPRCAMVKPLDIEALRKKQMQFPKFKARPSPFKKKKADKDKDKSENGESADNEDKPESIDGSEKTEKPEKKEKPKKLPKPEKKPAEKPAEKPDPPTLKRVPLSPKLKPKGRPPIPPPSPRAPFKKPQKSIDKPTSQNGTSKSAAAGDASDSAPTTPTTAEDKLQKDGVDGLTSALSHTKAGSDGLMPNLLDLGTPGEGHGGKGGTRRSSASGESVGSAGAESSATGLSSLNPPAKRVIETKSTLKRRQAIIAKKNAPPPEEESDDYLTPSQRKEKMMKDLKKELKNIQVALACKEVEMHDLLLNKEGESWERLKAKDQENSNLRKELVETKDLLSDMETKLTEMTEKLEARNKTIREMQEEMDRREHANQEMYLKMYEKGQQSAMFERQDQLEKMAEDEPDSVSPGELLHKLEMTQKELIRWQALKRQESYDEAARPETPAEAKLNFLKDSMYHYLTDRETEGMHLRAMVGLLGFTEVQIRKIRNASKESKSKGRRSSTK